MMAAASRSEHDSGEKAEPPIDTEMDVERDDGVGAESEERGMTEGEKAGVANQEIEAHRKDREDQDLGDERHDVARRDQGKRRKQHDGERRQQPAAARTMRRLPVHLALGDCRRHCAQLRFKPKRPVGRVSNTMIIST